MKRGVVFLAALVALACVAAASAAPPQGKGPGERGKGKDGDAAASTAAAYAMLAANAELTEAIDVNVVFVGIEAAQVPWASVTPGLSTAYKPVVRSRLWYGVKEELGLSYSYSYNPVYAETAWENAFFTFLTGKAVSKPLTLFQEEYNAQGGALDLPANGNHWIAAADVEAYLRDNAPAGVDTTKPTIYFVDWYGKPGFKFHVYTKTDEADPDTGYNFGDARASRKLVAWGGTAPGDDENGYAGPAKRVWFYDFSAGPESWGGNYDVDNADIDGDGVADYRIPVSWEYGHYRPASEQPGDVAKLIRYVGMNLLFATSPLYPPYQNADKLTSTIELDSHNVEGWNKVDADSFISKDVFEEEENDLAPATGRSFTYTYEDEEFKGDVKNCYLQWVVNVRCYNDRSNYPAFANIFLNAALSDYRDGSAPYEAILVNYAVGIAPKGAGLLGFADDNWIDGTQSGVFSFVYPDVAPFYGLTTTMIHEYGHHSSLSHPHDGFDWQDAAAAGDEPWLGDYGPEGSTFYAWAGDESNSMMSYIDLNWDFSQFDLDNSARHHSAGYVKIARSIAEDVLASPGAGNAGVAAQLAAADSAIGLAQLALAAHDYQGMLTHAKAAYAAASSAAALAGVAVELRTPGPWTLTSPVKGGVGLDRKAYGVDLHEAANAKRMSR